MYSHDFLDDVLSVFSRVLTEVPYQSPSFFSAVTVLNKGSHYELSADLPGVPKEDVSLQVEGDTLTLKAVRNKGLADKERSFSKSWNLKFAVDTAKISAKLEHGVLTAVLPKRGHTETSTQITIL